MIKANIENIVASTVFAKTLDLNLIAQRIVDIEYEPDRFPGLVFRIKHPKTATLLFTSGKGICTGAKNADEIRKVIHRISDELQHIGLEVYEKKDLDFEIRNIVATAALNGELNLSQVAMGLGLENIEYEPEQFPGLVYRLKEPKVVMLLFSSGKIVCTGGRTVDDVSKAVNQLSNELISLELFL